MSDTHPDNPRSLAAIRSMIDAVDRDMLHLLARRTALVGELAEYKRRHGVPIRDLAREKQIVRDRRALAERLALAPEVVESVFRLIMWESRDRQASLRAEVPLDVEPRTVAVIGGLGQMGRCLCRLFEDLGHCVLVVDVETEITAAEAASVADVVVISVPIADTVSVIETVGPLVRNDALLMDVTSIKGPPVEAMLRCSTASVIGTHPMFGPSVHSLQGQRVILCRGRGEAWEAWLRETLHARGLVVREADPAAHDRAMAIVQVLVHYRTEVMGKTLARLGVSIDETLSYTSPIYLLELLMTARHFGQSWELYASIGMSNPAAEEVTAAFAAAAGEVRDLIVNGDEEGFARMFAETREYFGEFTSQALELSSYLIDRLVERA